MREDSSPIHIGILLLLLFIAVNLFILDFKVFLPGKELNLNKLKITEKNQPSIALQNQQVAARDPYFCPLACLDLINTATISSRLGSLEMTPAGGSAQNKAAVSKEYFIPLGSGSTSKNVWDDLISTETLIDTNVYGNIKEAYLIASMKNPTQNGQVEAQLYNVTDKNPVWGSHVIMNGPKEQTMTSGKIGLTSGAKLYRMQLKSSLGFAVSLENARLRLLAQ